jgi:hypothetical protein
VEQLAQQAAQEKILSIDKTRSTGGIGYSGRIVDFGVCLAFLSFSAWHWRSLRETPLWLTFYESAHWLKVRASLQPLEIEKPPRLLTTAENQPAVPLFLPVQSDRDVVLRALTDQLRAVATLLRKA